MHIILPRSSSLLATPFLSHSFFLVLPLSQPLPLSHTHTCDGGVGPQGEGASWVRKREGEESGSGHAVGAAAAASVASGGGLAAMRLKYVTLCGGDDDDSRFSHVSSSPL